MHHSGATAHMQHAEIRPMQPQTHAACCPLRRNAYAQLNGSAKALFIAFVAAGPHTPKSRLAPPQQAVRGPVHPLVPWCDCAKSKCQSPWPPSFASGIVARYSTPAVWTSQCQALCDPLVTCSRTTSEPTRQAMQAPRPILWCFRLPYLPTSRGPHASKRAQQQ